MMFELKDMNKNNNKAGTSAPTLLLVHYQLLDLGATLWETVWN